MGCGQIIEAACFQYNTPKIVLIRSRKIGLLNRLIQLSIIGYVVGYAIIYKKGYQEFDIVQSSVTTKVKGTVLQNISAESSRIWDTADYVYPAQENGAFFVTTNALITWKQMQGICPEDPTIKPCEFDSDCIGSCDAGVPCPIPSGNGWMTGNCVNITTEQKEAYKHVTNATKSCEIHAWCPTEIDLTPSPPILANGKTNDSRDFTVLIKNSIEFPKFNAKRRNILDSANNKTYLTGCKYNSETDPFCPIFLLSTIVEEAGENYTKLAVKGGVVAIQITWDCNLDFNIENCKPKYAFRRLDNPDTQIAPGWNFRYAYFSMDANNTQQRTLYKAFGIRFVFFVGGSAGKFSLFPLLINVGSGLALLGVAVVLCDMIVLYLLKRREYYAGKKYLQVQDDAGSSEDRKQILKEDEVANNYHTSSADLSHPH